MSTDGARVLYTNVSLSQVIEQAYKVQEYQVEGPSWLTSERFDITAAIPAGTAKDQVPSMLQTLLADRFGLVLHHQTKQLPVLALNVAKGGTKLKSTDEARGIHSDGNGKNLHVEAKTSMSDFAAFLSRNLKQPVLDKTGLSGSFEIAFDCAPDMTSADNPDSGPSIFTALRETLGLKLDAMKGPVDILVIDRASRPSDN